PAPARLLKFVPAPCRTARTKALSMPADIHPEVIWKQPGNKGIFPLVLDGKKRHVEPGGTAGNSVSSFRAPPVRPCKFLGRYHLCSPLQVLTIIRCRLPARAYFPVAVVARAERPRSYPQPLVVGKEHAEEADKSDPLENPRHGFDHLSQKQDDP